MELTIRERRLESGMTVSELARRLDTSVANMSRWEREPQRINLVTLEKISDVLGVPPEALISKDGKVPAGQVSGATKTLVVTVPSLQPDRPAFPFDRNYLLSISQRPAAELGSAIVVDDAMAPTLRRGDALLIEPCGSVTEAGLYASVSDGTVNIRRVMAGLKPGTISVMTDNDDYPDFHDATTSDYPVAGRVVWIGRALA